MRRRQPLDGRPGSDRESPGQRTTGRWLSIAAGTLAAVYPGSPSPGDELQRAIAFLGWRVDPREWLAAGYGAALLATVVLVGPVWLVAPSGVAAVTVVSAVGLGVATLARRGPVGLAAIRRTTALGAAPGIVARAVLRMQVEPTAESAATFAADSGRGPLAASLRAHVRRARGTPRTGLTTFAEEWAEWFPALRRSVGLVVAAASAPEGERSRTLDRALSSMLEGTHERMSAFAETVRGPATALYAFGVLLPLALVAMLPAARSAGVPVGPVAFVAVYDLCLPAIVVVASAWLLVRRPVAFPPPAVDRSHPDVPADRYRPVAAGTAVALGSLFVVPRLLPGWLAPVVAVGAGIGTTLVGLYRPIATVRRRVRSVESGLPDALYLVGRRITEGEAVETAIEHAAAELSGATAAVLTEAVAVGRRLRVDVRDSFLGEHGALADVPSSRARSTAALLAAAAEEGRPAGTAVVAMANHLDDLETVEREARRELARVTGTLRSTGSVFGPLVAGATVALSGGISGRLGGGSGLAAGSTALEAGGTIPTGTLGMAVGAYVLLLATVLTALATGLERGLDGPLVGYRVGRALVLATTVYALTVGFVGAFV